MCTNSAQAPCPEGPSRPATPPSISPHSAPSRRRRRWRPGLGWAPQGQLPPSTRPLSQPFHLASLHPTHLPSITALKEANGMSSFEQWADHFDPVNFAVMKDLWPHLFVAQFLVCGISFLYEFLVCGISFWFVVSVFGMSFWLNFHGTSWNFSRGVFGEFLVKQKTPRKRFAS